ncbi:MAG: ABC transporter ATP-binding protein [Acidobacteria bacterium]|nr:ABC transporter ATP-binding protein [Acidobacteriota bacterium]
MILEMLQRYRLRFALGAGLLLATNAIALCIPLLLRAAVEALRQGGDPVGRYALFIALLGGGQAVVRTASRLAILGASRQIAYDLRNRFFTHLQRLPASFHARTPIGDLMSRAVNDMMSVRSFFGPGVMNIVNTTIVYISGLCLMTWISPQLTLVALFPLPLLMFAVQRTSRRLYSRSRAVQERLAQLSEQARENLRGIQLVKTYAREDAEVASFARVSAAYRDDTLSLARVRGILIPLMGSLGGMSSLMAVWFGGRLVAVGTISLGDFVAFSAYLAMMVWPTVAMGWVINSFQRGRVAMVRLQEILDLPPETDEGGGDMSITELHGEIEIRNLTVSHIENGPPALHNLSLRIGAGETVALVGPVGSGKSTVAEILPRFLRVPDGTVFMDGHDINRIPLSVLRRHLGYAPQEAFLFSRSLRDNIAFGLENPVADEVERAAVLSGLSRDLDGFPAGLETLVGEGGVTLSGGQRQRTALARALVRGPRILILDDSLSSVDSETEQQILDGLEQSTQRRTTLLISHRLTTASRADRVIVLDAGRAVEEGTPGSLLAQGGLFAEMCRRQELEGSA